MSFRSFFLMVDSSDLRKVCYILLLLLQSV
jgi:hypothetical protein